MVRMKYDFEKTTKGKGKHSMKPATFEACHYGVTLEYAQELVALADVEPHFYSKDTTSPERKPQKKKKTISPSRNDKKIKSSADSADGRPGEFSLEVSGFSKYLRSY